MRGRLGVAVTPDLLLYGTGGLAYGHVDASANTQLFNGDGSLFAEYPASISTTKVGWTAGAGAEWMFARNWSAKLEYLYVDLGSESAIVFANNWIAEYDAGLPNYKKHVEEEAAHPITETGKQLRSMMSWIRND